MSDGGEIDLSNLFLVLSNLFWVFERVKSKRLKVNGAPVFASSVATMIPIIKLKWNLKVCEEVSQTITSTLCTAALSSIL